MKIQSKAAEAFVSKNVETYSASIAMTPEVFNILVKGIYKYEERAVIRELICNARDAQVEAGVNKPLNIHLPTFMEPWFSVKDQGLGMSKEMVTTTFMCLGTSTKTENPDLIGAKGIGSKSPFCLVDAFSVTSWFNGVKSSYSVFMNRGIPDVAPLFNNETTEPNGVEVQVAIPVDTVDFFNKEAKKFFALFDYPFETNLKDLEIEKLTPAFILEKDDFKVEIFSEESSKDLTNLVVMGGVGYESKSLKGSSTRYNVTVPIGAVNISPGREYTMENDYPEFAEKVINLCTEAYDAYEQSLKDSLKKLNKISEFIGFYRIQNYMGKVVTTKYVEEILGNKKTLEKFYYYDNSRKYPKNGRVFSEGFPTEVLLSGEGLIMLKDNKTKVYQRSGILCEKYNKKYVYSLNLEEMNKSFLDFTLLYDLMHLATEAIPNVVKQKKARGPRASYRGHVVYRVSLNNGITKERLMKEEIKEINYYLTRCDMFRDNGVPSTKEYGNIRNYYNSLLESHNIDELYILSEKQIAWTDGKVFQHHISKELKKDIKENFYYSNYYNDYVEAYNWLQKVKGLKGRLELKKCNKLPAWVNSIFKDKSKLEDEIKEIIKNKVKSYSEDLENFKNAHPLLGYIEEEYWEKPEVKHYITLVKEQEIYNGK